MQPFSIDQEVLHPWFDWGEAMENGRGPTSSRPVLWRLLKKSSAPSYWTKCTSQRIGSDTDVRKTILAVCIERKKYKAEDTTRTKV